MTMQPGKNDRMVSQCERVGNRVARDNEVEREGRIVEGEEGMSGRRWAARRLLIRQNHHDDSEVGGC